MYEWMGLCLLEDAFFNLKWKWKTQREESGGGHWFTGSWLESVFDCKACLARATDCLPSLWDIWGCRQGWREPQVAVDSHALGIYMATTPGKQEITNACQWEAYYRKAPRERIYMIRIHGFNNKTSIVLLSSHRCCWLKALFHSATLKSH